MADATAGALVLAASQKAELVSGRQKKEGKEEVLLRLQQNDPTLTSLRIMPGRGKSKDGAYIRPRTEEDWLRLGDALTTNTKLQRLDLMDLRLDPMAGRCIGEFYSKLNKNRTLRRLGLSNMDLYEGRIFSVHLREFLESNPRLTSLAFARVTTFRGWRHFPTSLSTLPGPLRYLDLSHAMINQQMCQDLVNSLESHRATLKSLEMICNDVRCDGCVAIANLLNNPNSVLVRLNLDSNNIGSRGAAELAHSLTNNSSLKTLSIDRNRAITVEYGAFLRTVCNSPNIDNIMQSNHTLQRLGEDPRGLMPEELTYYLHLNKTRNKAHVASQKVARHHFIYNCNLELFEEIPGSLLPNVLAMIAEHEGRPTSKNKRTDAKAGTHHAFMKDDHKLRHRALHRLLRRCPWICERHTNRKGFG